MHPPIIPVQRGVSPNFCKESRGSLQRGRTIGPRIRRIRKTRKKVKWYGRRKPFKIPGIFDLWVKARMDAILRDAPPSISEHFGFVGRILPGVIEAF